MSGALPVLEQLMSELARDPASDTAGYACVPAGQTWRLKIWGNLPSAWAGNVSLHCHGAKIDIVEGDALRVRERMWAGAFSIGQCRGASNPGGFDFLQMARRRPIIPSLIAPEILELAIERDREAESATLRVVGRDQLGFLAFLLAKIDACELEAHRISLRTTREGLARDQLVLFGSNGTPAKHHALECLRRALAG